MKDSINEVLACIIARLDFDEKKQPAEKKPARPHRNRLGPIIGCSQAINEIFYLIDKLQNVSSTVLIQGESGVGKELIAQTLHQTSQRKNGPFVAINCGAIPANLIESELFGHERGAFTSAISRRKGKFEIACDGTIFLDEISELDRDLQVKLLRVLQEREFQRVGGNDIIKTNARVIAAANQDLKKAVAEGRFRDDLFFRLNIIPLYIPPLRERQDDIPLLLTHFLETISEKNQTPQPHLTASAKNALSAHSYPGNVRELANIVERLCVLCPGKQVELSDLPPEISALSEKTASAERQMSCIADLPQEGVPMREIEKELIIKTLEKTAGNKTAAAQMMGITRRRLYLRLSEYGIACA